MTRSGWGEYRTLALAAVAWAGSVIGWRWGFAALAVLPFATTAAAGAWWSRCRRVRPSPLQGGDLWMLAAATVVLLASCVAAALSVAARQVPSEAEGRSLTFTAGVAGAGRPLAGPAAGAERVMVSVRINGLQVGASRWRLATPAVVFGDDSDWGSTEIGSTIRFSGELLPGGPESVVVVARSPPTVVEAPSGPQQALNRFRHALRDRLAEGAAGRGLSDAASLVAGLSLGDESGQSPMFAADMRESGLSHLTAVSGGNVAIVLLVVVLTCRAARIGIPGTTIAAAAVLAGYVALVGPQPSVVRAAAMGTAGLIGVLLGGGGRGVSLLSAAVLVLVLFDPALAVSVGFALSAAATAALILVAPRLYRRLRARTTERIRDGWLLALSVTVSAQLFTAPLLLGIGAPVSVVAVPANLLAAPLVAPITILGLTVTLIAPVLPGVAAVLVVPALLSAELLVRIATTGAAVAGTPAAAALTHLCGVAVVSVAGVLALRCARRLVPLWTERRFLGCVLAVCLAAGATAAAWQPLRRTIEHRWVPSDWRMIVCDVGQGAAVLLRDAADRIIVVDVGPVDGGITRCLEQAGAERVELVILSHFHADHVAGLADALASLPVGTVATTPFVVPEENAAQVQRQAAAARVPVTAIAAGRTITFDRLTLRILWPPPTFTGTEEDANDASVVVHAVWADGAAALLTGDVEPEAQRRILALGPAPRVQAVTIPHHGSAHQDTRWAGWVRATVAVASVGADNDYGHPSDATMGAYRAAGARVLRTDTAGAVALCWTGGQVSVATAVPDAVGGA